MNEVKTVWNGNFIRIMAVNALIQLSIQIINTTIVPYVIWAGAAVSLAGTVSGMCFIISLIARPFSGMCANTFDKKKLLMAAVFLQVIVSVCLAGVTSIPVILVVRVFQGIGYALTSTICMAIVADFVPDGMIGKGIGYFGLSQCIAQIAGPGLGLAVAERVGYNLTYAMAAVFFIAGLILVFQLKTVTKTDRPKLNLSLLAPRNLIAKEALLTATVGLLFSILNSCLSAYMAVYAQYRVLTGAGVFFMISAAAMFLSRLFSSENVDKRSLAFTGVVSGSLLISSMLLLGFGASNMTMWAAAAVFGVGYGFLLPVTQSRSVAATPPEKHGTGSSTYYIGIDLGFSIGNILGGFLTERFGPANMYLILIIPALVSISICVIKGRDR